MFTSVLKFELKYWLKNISIYVYALIFFFLSAISMAGAAGIFGEGSTGLSIANSPLSIYSFAGFFNKLLLFLIPTIIGYSVYRDYKNNVHSLLYSYPLTKIEYLAGKFASSFLIVTGISLAVMLGLVTGTMLPGVDQKLVMPFDTAVYIQTFFIYLLPNLFLTGAIVFAVVLITRNIYAGFITVILIFMITEILTQITGGPDIGTFGLLIDPFGFAATDYFTRDLTPAESDNAFIPFNSIIIFNRLIWIAVGSFILVSVYSWFSFSQGTMTFSFNFKKRESLNDSGEREKSKDDNAAVSYEYSFFRQLNTIRILSKADFKYIISSGSFISILIAGALLTAVLLLQMNPVTDTKILPVTWMILGLPVFFFSFLILGLTFLYAGILIHRPNSARMQDLINVTPASDGVLFLSKLLTLIKMQMILLSLIMVTGIGVQLYSGYYNFEIGHYLFDLFVIHLIGFVIWAMASLLVQTLFKNPYLGLFILILFTFALSNLPAVGINSSVFVFNQNPDPDFIFNYSDMNGYGHSLIPYFIYKFYWLIFGLLLCCLTLLFWQRKITETFMERIVILGKRLNSKMLFLIVTLTLCFMITGLFIYKEENEPLNQRLTKNGQNILMERFREKFGKLKNINQPKITSVFSNINIYPEERSFDADGYYTLTNKTEGSIDTLLIKSGFDEITEISFNREVSIIDIDSTFNFAIYKLSNGIAPQESINIFFKIKNKPNTVLSQNSNVLDNGTFIKNDIFPRIGYFADIEKSMPDDSSALMNHYQSKDADLIDIELIVSTSAEQTAIAPGKLLRSWTENNRKYFQFKPDRQIKFVFGINSGIFDLYKENHKGTELGIYYHPKHNYNLKQMIEGLKASLDYNSEYFSEYQHSQAYIIEFPRSEGTYATTSANCIQVSEIRFINDPDNAGGKSIDIAFYVAAHELTHQWWGNQVIPADVKGALMITESITEYITAKIYERKYGKESAAKFLEIQLNRYKNGRTTESDTEEPLMYVKPEQSYISYGKGAIAFYTLSEFIGEENLNKALKRYLEKVKYQYPPYTASPELIQILKEATPEDRRYLIEDMFESADSEKMINHFKNLKLNEDKNY